MRWARKTALVTLPLGCMTAAAAPFVLENESARVVIDPERGRVMEFFPKEISRNVLWTDPGERDDSEDSQLAYRNWGGDKVWPAAQPFWRFAIGRIWPPDAATDGMGATRSRSLSPKRVRFEFASSDHFHTKLEREFELDETGPVLRIQNRVTQVRRSPLPAQIWSVTQVPLPERVLMDIAPGLPERSSLPVNLNGIGMEPPLGPKPFPPGSVASGDDWTRIHPAVEDGQLKAGALGEWIAGVWSDGLLLQRVELDADGMYPEATSLQFYHDSRYGELETLSPARLLAPGESIENTVIWRWLGSADTSGSDAEIVRLVREAINSPEVK